jgi:hypothetical protein
MENWFLIFNLQIFMPTSSPENYINLPSRINKDLIFI